LLNAAPAAIGAIGDSFSVQHSTDNGATWQNATASGALADPGAPYGADGAPE
jgi:hypothetical protein